jgi:hypothetical protein
VQQATRPTTTAAASGPSPAGGRHSGGAGRRAIQAASAPGQTVGGRSTTRGGIGLHSPPAAAPASLAQTRCGVLSTPAGTPRAGPGARQYGQTVRMYPLATPLARTVSGAIEIGHHAFDVRSPSTQLLEQGTIDLSAGDTRGGISDTVVREFRHLAFQRRNLASELVELVGQNRPRLPHDMITPPGRPAVPRLWAAAGRDRPPIAGTP